MKLMCYILCCVIALIFFLLPVAKAQERPNIIFIIGDDISQEDIGCYGNTSIRTPNIDLLARQGMKFNNAFVTSSSCSPSRCSIISGRYPHNTGAAELHSALPDHLTTFPEQLKAAGYYTAQAGKWHEGPNTASAYDTLLAGTQLNGNGGEGQWLRLLAQRPVNKPFFFWLAPFDAHRDWGADGFGKPHHPDSVWVPPTLVDDEATRNDLASYYNEIGRIDHYLGLLMNALAQQGIASNTMIIFISDNARPFPGSKTRLYDRGIKTPMLIRWPAVIEGGAICQSMISSIDIAPTLLELAGVVPAESIQGRSFTALFQRPERAFREHVFAEHNWHDYEAYERSVRTKDFFYLVNLRPERNNIGAIDVNQSPAATALKNAAQTGTLTSIQRDPFLQPRPAEELYDLAKDPLQQHNLADDTAYRQQRNALHQVLMLWREQTADTAPGNLTPDWYDRRTSAPLPAKGTRGEMPGAAKEADRVNHKGPF